MHCLLSVLAFLWKVARGPKIGVDEGDDFRCVRIALILPHSSVNEQRKGWEFADVVVEEEGLELICVDLADCDIVAAKQTPNLCFVKSTRIKWRRINNMTQRGGTKDDRAN